MVVSVEVDRDRRWQQDCEIPRRHGVEHVLGENARAGRASRTRCARSRSWPASPATSSGSRPTRCSLNFTNPEGRICTAFRRHLDQPVIGLCHEVEIARRRFSKLLGRDVECRAAGLNHLTALVDARAIAATGCDVTAELHAAVDRLADDDGDTFEFVRYLHDKVGVVIATSDSHAGEYYREAVEHAAPKDFVSSQSDMRKLMDDVAGLDRRGQDRSRRVLRLRDDRAAAPDPARRDHGRRPSASRRRSCPTTASCPRSRPTVPSR